MSTDTGRCSGGVAAGIDTGTTRGEDGRREVWICDVRLTVALGAELGGYAGTPGAGIPAVADRGSAGAEVAVRWGTVAAVGGSGTFGGQINVDGLVGMDSRVACPACGAVACGTGIAVSCIEVFGMGSGEYRGGGVAMATGAGQDATAPSDGLVIARDTCAAGCGLNITVTVDSSAGAGVGAGSMSCCDRVINIDNIDIAIIMTGGGCRCCGSAGIVAVNAGDGSMNGIVHMLGVTAVAGRGTGGVNRISAVTGGAIITGRTPGWSEGISRAVGIVMAGGAGALGINCIIAGGVLGSCRIAGIHVDVAGSMVG